MKSKELIRRKRKLQWSDLQLLVLIELAEKGRLRFMDLVTATGASTTGVWNVLINPIISDLIVKEYLGTQRIYTLSPDGKRSMAELFTPSPGKRAATPPP